MKPILFRHLLVAIFTLALLSPFAAAATQAEASAESNVSVHYQDPHKFTENRMSGIWHEFDRGDYLQKLRAFVIKTASPILAPGQHLAITFTDIKLAGSYEPWRGPYWQDVRFMRDIYPPRFDLTFQLTGADGQVLREGTRKLTNLGYLYDSPGGLSGTGPLQYDKALLQRWLRRGPAKW